MTFSNWYVLIGLFLPLALLVWTWRRAGRRVVLPVDYSRARPGRLWQFLLSFAESLPALLLAVAILLLAGPRHHGVPREQRVLTNIEFCLDLSGSMMAPFGEATRYDAAMDAICEFVDVRRGDAFGLTLFAIRSLPWIPLTSDPSAFKNAIPFVRPEQMMDSLGGGTMIGAALRACREHLLARNEGDRMILLVSDGASFDLDDGQDEIIARELSGDGIVVYGVHIGEGIAPPEVAALCTLTGGASFATSDQASLKQMFQRIDAMHGTRMERTVADELDWFWPFCLAGLILLGMAAIAAFGLRYTPW